MLWGRHVAARLGSERVLFMSDDKLATRYLADQPDRFFQLVPARLECLPLYRAGLLGWGEAQESVKYIKTGKGKGQGAGNWAGARGRGKGKGKGGGMAEELPLPADCGPPEFSDDGIQLFAGIALLASCSTFIGARASVHSYHLPLTMYHVSSITHHASRATFVGTQVSNVDRLVVELMSALRHPPR